MSHLVDAYLIDGLIVYRGLSKGGYVGKGFRVHAPDSENADIDWLNRLEDETRVLLTSLKDDTRMQIHWSVDSDYKQELLRYYQVTKERASNEWSRGQRNERFTRYWEKMERRELRRECLHIYVTSKVQTEHMPLGKGQRTAYEYILAASQRELKQYGELFEQIFAGLGGSVEPLDDLGHFREFYRFFNASAADIVDLDYEQLYRPEHGIMENCFNGEAAPLSKPDLGFYLDGYYHGVLAVKNLPKATFSGMMAQLTNLDMLDYAITVNIRPLDVIREIEREEGAFEKLQHTLQHSPKLRMLAAMQKKSRKIARLMSNQVLPYQAQFILRAWDKEKAGLRAKMAALRSAIGKMNGAKYYDPALPTSSRNYYYATIPGWCWTKYDGCAHYIEDVNLANLLPISATPIGDLAEAEAIYDGANRNLIGVKTFAGRQGEECAQHGAVFGMSGAGKSVNMVDLLSQTEPYYDYTVIVEEGLSYLGYSKTVDPTAKPIIIQPNGSLTFNYLDTLGLPLSAHHLADATALCALLIGHDPDPARQKLREAHLAGCIRQLYQDFFDDWARKHPEEHTRVARDALALRAWSAENESMGGSLQDGYLAYREWARRYPEEAQAMSASFPEPDVLRYQKSPETAYEVCQLAFATFRPEQMPMHSHLQELMAMESHGADTQEIRHLAKLLEPWCAHGNHGRILDGMNNVRLDGKIAHFELGSIPESAEDLRAVAAFLITNHIRHEIMSRPRTTRKRVVLEELSAFLTIPNADRITREFYERMRKYQCWVISVIQQFSRFKDSSVRNSIMGNSRLLFLLKQQDRTDLDQVSESFPLPEVTKHTIAHFPEPSRARQRAYSGFVYYRLADMRPIICTGRNEASREMLQVSQSRAEEK